MDVKSFNSQFLEIVDKSQNILISSHKNPDPDSYASVLSMITYLKERYPKKSIQGKYTGDIVDTWADMPNANLISSSNDIADELDKFDLLIVVDVHPCDRYVNNVDKLKDSKCKKICIDHHALSSEVNYDLFFNEPKATSAAELIYKIFLEDEKKLSPALCESILMGILGDTMWMTVNMRSDTIYIFDIVKRLVLEGNINLEHLRHKTFIYNKEIFPAFKNIVSNSKIIKVGDWPEMIVGFIARKDMIENDLTELKVKLASNHFVNSYPKTFSGVSWGASAYPLDNGGVSISLRSLPDSINVRALALEFGGGGHDGSASIKFHGEGVLDAEECLAELYKWLESNRPIFR